MADDPFLLKIGCVAEAMLGPEKERFRAFEHIIFETHPPINWCQQREAPRIPEGVRVRMQTPHGT
jgi:hypothetical protein